MDSNQPSQPPAPAPQAADAAGAGEKQLAFEAPPQPVREEYVQNAVKFLSHPKVRGSAVVYRRSFLQNKGLTNDEIDEAFRRVPDPPPTTASPPTQTQSPVPAAAPQAYAQPAAGPIVVAAPQPRLTWYRAFIAAGLLLGFGASAAVFVKKILVTLTQALDSQAKVLKSLSESLSHSRDSVNITREDRFSHYRPLEEHAPSATRNGPVNTPWRPPQQPNMYGAPNSDFGSGRPSFAPAPTEPTSGSYSRSYVETVQRGDNRSSGTKTQQALEMLQHAEQKLAYRSNAYLSEDGSYSQAQDNYAPSYHQNGKAPDFHAEEPRPLAYSSGVVERPPPQRQWVPPQPPGVAMPEAAAAIRQQKSLTKQPSSDTSEAAGEVQVNGAASSPSVAAAEVPVNGSAASDAGRSEIEEQAEAAA
ncbi:hypothetical protein CFC21_000025 [Triticum aestivum]|uniref:Peroxisomal membrane protein PEX14 n=1 Tax=Triticum aestivum TaxID=4565 RepID=A0A3B5XU07_WHEAT|nr:hypothetical protein CFC21_000025 [Triticum aestivum]